MKLATNLHHASHNSSKYTLYLEYFLKFMEMSAFLANTIRAGANQICCEHISEVVGTYSTGLCDAWKRQDNQ